MNNLKDWLQSGKYLPEPLRDFHDQKTIFKRVDDFKWGGIGEKPNWISAQIYVIDLFLFFMARHGYTLQKSKAKIDFEDIYKTMQECEDSKFDMLKQFMKQKTEEKAKGEA